MKGNRKFFRSAFRILFIFFLAGGMALSQVPRGYSSDIQTFYGPEDRLLDHLLALYRSAEHFIYIACYDITSKPVVEALIQAKKNGIDVRIITDQGELENRNTQSAIRRLIRAGIRVKVNRHEGLMHIKQVVIDDRVNTSGSFNQTWSANFLNDERFDVITDPSNTSQAGAKFLTMWNDPAGFVDLKKGF